MTTKGGGWTNERDSSAKSGAWATDEDDFFVREGDSATGGRDWTASDREAWIYERDWAIQRRGLFVDRPASRRRRGPRVFVVLLVAIMVMALAALAGGSWMFSSELLRPEHKGGPYGVTVRQLEGRRVVLARDGATARRGIYGLDWPSGHAVIGDIVSTTASTVTRQLVRVRGQLRSGSRVAIDNAVWDGTPRSALRIPYARVRVTSSLGSLPAWLVNPPQGQLRSPTWAIYVHGRNGAPREGLRKMRALRAAGMPTLLMTYRNDVGAPPSRDGRLHLGDSEWRDLQAAARFARAHGARDFVLVGDSMGGAIVTQFVERSPLAPRVRALVLDSPVLDWRKVLSLQASNRGLPGVLARTTGWLVERRTGIDLDAFDQVSRAREVHRPILLFHGTADRKVPISTSDAFARALPRLVTYRRVRGAGHVQSWNVNPRAYERALSMFLKRVGAARMR